MDIDEEDVIISNYSVLIEDMLMVKSFYQERPQKNYTAIQQKLIKCWQQIDDLITFETNHISFLALCQQKHQLTGLIEIIEKLKKSESIYPHNISDCMFFKNTQTTIEQNHKNNKIDNALEIPVEIPKIRGFSEIIGLQEIKKVLKSLIILPKTQPQLFYNRQICNSILLYGPPGTGKTRLCHALAAEANAAFRSISAGDILSHYVGQTEKTIKKLFQFLKKSYEFSILFIDEFDALCRKRSENEQEHCRRFKTEFMCQMSSIEDYKNIIVICATNCPWDLDSAILRRLHKRIYVPLPNEIERLEFFRVLTNNVHFEDINDWSLLVQRTQGYSGSDLSDVVHTATTIPLNELEDTKIWKCCDDGCYQPVSDENDFSNVICSDLRDLPSNSVRARKVQMNDLINAVNTVKSTVTESDVKKYEKFYRA